MVSVALLRRLSGPVFLLAAASSSFGQKLYWTTPSQGAVFRANLDGTDVETVVSMEYFLAQGIALDLTANKMYWTNNQARKIQRANLDGSNIEDVVADAPTYPDYIALDVEDGKMYWSDDYGIVRANLDGTQVLRLVTRPSARAYWPIALDLQGRRVHWFERRYNGIFYDGVVRRVDFDGTQMETVVTFGHTASPALAIDSAGGTIYWTDNAGSAIQRSSLDGVLQDPLPLEDNDAVALILDPLHSAIFYARWGSGGVVRLIGPDFAREVLLSEIVTFPIAIALDPRLPGDCNGNEHLAMDDLLDLTTCLGNPGQSMPNGCACLDLNGDGDVDLADFGALQVGLGVE